MKIKNFVLVIFFALLSSSFCAADLTHYCFPDPPFIKSFLEAKQVVSTIQPASIGQGQTLPITITGTDFASSATVEIIPASGLSILSTWVYPPSKIVFTLTASTDAPTGPKNLKVYNPTGSYEVTNALYVISSSIINPTITRLSPDHASAGETLTLTIEGTDFKSGAQVSFVDSLITITTYEVISSTKIQAQISIATTASAGTVSLIVINPDTGTAVKNFTIEKPKEGFTITGTWPNMEGNAFPRGSTISPFIIQGTGINSQVVVTFADPNITFNNADMSVDPNGKWIYIKTLVIGEKTALGPQLITITNYPDLTTATTTINIKEKTEFLNIVTNFAPVYSGNVTGFSLSETTPMTFKLYTTKDLAEAHTFISSPTGLAQFTKFANVVRGSTVKVQGVSASDVRTFSVSSSGTGKIELPKVSDRNVNLGPGVYSIRLKVRATDGTEQVTKVNFVIRPQ